MINKIGRLLSISLILLLCLTSCALKKLVTSKVTYQSIRTTEYHEQIPNNAEIVVAYSVTKDGSLVVLIVNKTDEIMMIDQTASFFVDTDGSSYSYYDPTIRTSTVTDIASSTSGMSVNLGSVARGLGIGGIVGGVLSGVNVGGSDTYGQSVSNTTYVADLPQVSLAPRGSGVLSKNFQISRLSREYLMSEEKSFVAQNEKKSPHKFNVCISYSFDQGKTYKKLITEFYVNSQIIEMVKQNGEVNRALCEIYKNKQDAINEPLWIMQFLHNITEPDKKSKILDAWSRGVLLDYK